MTAQDLFEKRYIRPHIHPQFVVDSGDLVRHSRPSDYEPVDGITLSYQICCKLIDDLEGQGIVSWITAGGVRVSPTVGAGVPIPNQMAKMFEICKRYGVRPHIGETWAERVWEASIEHNPI